LRAFIIQISETEALRVTPTDRNPTDKKSKKKTAKRKADLWLLIFLFLFGVCFIGWVVSIRWRQEVRLLFLRSIL
jgi:hypothetical protein